MFVSLVKGLVVGPEVSHVHLNVLGHFHAGSQSYGVAAGHEAHVGQVASVRQVIFRALHTCAHGDGVCDVIFRSRVHFPCVAAQLLLFFVCHVRVLVEEEVVARHQSQVAKQLILRAYGKQGGDISWRVHAVCEKSRVVHLGVILYVAL